jgi:hypothetical protein
VLADAGVVDARPGRRRAGGQTVPVRRQWQITDEFGQRLGCGLATAVILPVWFALVLFAVADGAAALGLAGAFFLVALVGGLAGRWRIRRLPRTVTVDDTSGELSFSSRLGVEVRSARQLEGVVIGTSLGLAPVQLRFTDGPPLRLPRHFDAFDELLAELRRLQPALEVTDRNAHVAGGPGA